MYTYRNYRIVASHAGWIVYNSANRYMGIFDTDTEAERYIDELIDNISKNY